MTVDVADSKGRFEILKVHARNKKLAEDVDLKEIAMRTPGFSGADLANLLNEVGSLLTRLPALSINAHTAPFAMLHEKDFATILHALLAFYMLCLLFICLVCIPTCCPDCVLPGPALLSCLQCRPSFHVCSACPPFMSAVPLFGGKAHPGVHVMLLNTSTSAAYSAHPIP